MRDQAENKGVTKFLRKKLTYVLCLSQVAEHESLPPVCKSMADASNKKQLTTLQKDFDDRAWWLGVHAPIVATLDLLKMTMSLSFHLNNRDNLWTGLYQFCLGQHTFNTRNILKAHIYQHKVIAVRVRDQTLEDAAALMAHDEVSLTETLDISQSTHAHLQVVLDTLLRRDHPSAHIMDAFMEALMDWETEIEEYPPRAWGMRPKLPALLTQWVHIYLSDCIFRKWERGGDNLSQTWRSYG